MYNEEIKDNYDYTQKDTFMGFHCGNTAKSKLSFCEMKYQKIMARTLPEEVTQGTLEGDIAPGDITFFRLQSTADTKLRAYVAQGEILPVATRSFGSIGVFAIPEMGRFYRHVLIEKNFPHHGADHVSVIPGGLNIPLRGGGLLQGLVHGPGGVIQLVIQT